MTDTPPPVTINGITFTPPMAEADYLAARDDRAAVIAGLTKESADARAAYATVAAERDRLAERVATLEKVTQGWVRRLWGVDYAATSLKAAGWTSVQQPAGTTRATIVDGRMRVENRPGEITDTGGYLASRVEAYARGSVNGVYPDPVGSTRVYEFTLELASDFEFDMTNELWLTLTQLKGAKGGSPPLAIEVRRDRLVLGGTLGGGKDLGAAPKGRKITVRLAVKFAADASGFVQAWVDGAEKVAKTPGATLEIVDGVADPVYLKQGIYRAKGWTKVHVAYFGPASISTPA